MISKKEILIALGVTVGGLINPLLGGIFGGTALIMLALEFKAKSRKNLGSIKGFKENL